MALTHQLLHLVRLLSMPSGLLIPTTSPGMIKAQPLLPAVVQQRTQQQLLLQLFQQQSPSRPVTHLMAGTQQQMEQAAL